MKYFKDTIINNFKWKEAQKIAMDDAVYFVVFNIYYVDFNASVLNITKVVTMDFIYYAIYDIVDVYIYWFYHFII